MYSRTPQDSIPGPNVFFL